MKASFHRSATRRHRRVRPFAGLSHVGTAQLFCARNPCLLTGSASSTESAWLATGVAGTEMFHMIRLPPSMRGVAGYVYYTAESKGSQRSIMSTLQSRSPPLAPSLAPRSRCPPAPAAPSAVTPAPHSAPDPRWLTPPYDMPTPVGRAHCPAPCHSTRWPAHRRCVCSPPSFRRG
jgi:hypothetical protein